MVNGSPIVKRTSTKQGQKNMEVINKNIRKKAMKWWNNLAFETKFYHTIKNNDLITGDKTRYPDTLTGREIEIIYRAVKKVKDAIVESTSPKKLKQYTEQDVIVKQCKAPKLKCCENMPNTNEDMAALNVRRLQIQGINKTIEKYLSIKD